MLNEAGKTGEFAELREQVEDLVEENPFARRACETGHFREIILALERLNGEIGGKETELWVRGEQLEILSNSLCRRRCSCSCTRQE